ncbi:putative caltractin [Leishmania braziliensis MHOM/BR/75/M2904]|uniref:Caltractin n=2 Tax=Leishmania braziliensis TaxID=5660 RepID=A4HPA9_LEIBR|nr:putative caltractin [Leishmania braziliensis MHOM/BR/75/M2904]KAI5691311.1 hypothetical protein MNV84_08020 [Leishmania braziliensis]CAJ2481460.1 unnamed protein product [Leishmania braziliensis]CAJ2481857.1 unnamed protein product [Leishmania braziliensis]CAM44016.1 putative caltractin [Leishmania braziliensis MHOM/BR/75/M2904]
MQDVRRALYTITGQRVTRSELLKLIAFAQDAVAKQQQAMQHQQDQVTCLQRSKMASPEAQGPPSVTTITDGEVMSFSGNIRSPSQTGASISTLSVRAESPMNPQAAAATAGSTPAPTVRSQICFVSPRSHLLDSSEGIDLDVFEQIVLRKLKHRNYEEELAYTFALLEDKSYLGFITKESVRRAATETGEALTEAEIAEMFDPLVTGVSTAAVDLSTFTDLQLKARKAEDS